MKRFTFMAAGAAALVMILGLGVTPAAAATLHYGDFDHAVHADKNLSCADCHNPGSMEPSFKARMPDRAVCLDCHGEGDLGPMPPYPASHEANYRYEHQFTARNDDDDCAVCHRNSEDCIACHHGEKVDYIAHDRNWAYNHPLTYYKGTEECRACHDTRKFCSDCHLENDIRPGNHYLTQWTSPLYHGEEAKNDLNNCAQCHSGSEPVCIRCHGLLDQ